MEFRQPTASLPANGGHAVHHRGKENGDCDEAVLAERSSVVFFCSSSLHVRSSIEAGGYIFTMMMSFCAPG